MRVHHSVKSAAQSRSNAISASTSQHRLVNQHSLDEQSAWPVAQQEDDGEWETVVPCYSQPSPRYFLLSNMNLSDSSQ
jgi:hypothetical protein